MDDLVSLKNYILNFLEFRPYNNTTKKHADNIQWTRSASQIIKDGYVYTGKTYSDIALVFLACCKALGIKGKLVKLYSPADYGTHSIVEIFYKNKWHRIDPSVTESIFFKGELKNYQIWNKKFKVWKKGNDLWGMGLTSINSEKLIK